MSTQKVVIVGGGVIGLCSAYYALKQGMKVTLLERDAHNGDSCSMGNAGMVVPSHFIPLAAPGMVAKGLRMMLNPRSPFFIKPRFDFSLFRWMWLFLQHCKQDHVDRSVELLRDLNLESRRLFGELQDEGDYGLVKRGLLMLCNTQKGLDGEADVAAKAHEIGLRADVLDAAATAAADPSITMNVVGAVFFPDDCHMSPQRFVEAMRSRITAMGGEIVYQAEVKEWESSGNVVKAVIAGDSRHEADHFVVAGGSWSARLLADLGWRLPMQAGKGYSLTLRQPPQLPQLCSIFTEAKVAITPMGDSLRFGGTMEVGGLNRDINPMRVQGITRAVPEYFPEFRAEHFTNVEPWAGLRPVSPDGVPYLGKVPKFQNLIVATGHAMMGLSLAPVTGRVVADLLGNKMPFRDVSAMRLDRF